MPSRILDYPVFDADNHFYEPKECVYVTPFWEVDRVIFGSDWPHPEGLADPINLVSDLEAHGLDEEGVRKVMGRNMIDLFTVENKVVHRPDVPALVLA